MKKNLKNLALITFLAEVLPFIFVCIFFKKSTNKYLKVFLMYATLMFTLVASLFLFVNVFKTKDAYFVILRIYVVTEYLMICLFFYYLLNNKFFKKIVLISAIPFCIFSLYIYISSPKGDFNTTPVLLEFLLLIVVLLFYFVEKLQNVSTYPLYKTISFWLCVGFLFYFLGNFFYVLSVNTSKDPIFLKQSKLIYSIITITKDIILAFAWFAHEPLETEADIIHIPTNAEMDKDFDEFLENFKASK